MIGQQTLRFIGGILNNTFRDVLATESRVSVEAPAAPERKPGEFKKGDVVRFKLGRRYGGMAGPDDTAYTVLAVGLNSFYSQAHFIDLEGIEPDGLNRKGCAKGRFDLVTPAPETRAVKAGDTIELLEEYFGQPKGSRHTVDRIDGDGDVWFKRPPTPAGRDLGICVGTHRYRLVDSMPPAVYTRRRLLMLDAISRYEEECFVLESMTNQEATKLFRANLPTFRDIKDLRIPKMIETQPIHSKPSTLIHGLAYEKGTGTLDVTFRDPKGQPGAVYRYSNVPVATLGNLLTEESLGGGYTRLIRNAFPCTELA